MARCTLLAVALLISNAAALKLTRRAVFNAVPAAAVGAATAARAEDDVAAAVVPQSPSELAAASTTERKAALKPLYKAALTAKRSRRAAPGEMMNEPEEQGDSSPFVGKFTDPNHPGGTRDVTLETTQFGLFRLATVRGGGGRGEPASYELPAMVYGDRITVDFSPKGGPMGLTGTFYGGATATAVGRGTAPKGSAGGIKWSDENFWPKVEQQ